MYQRTVGSARTVITDNSEWTVEGRRKTRVSRVSNAGREFNPLKVNAYAGTRTALAKAREGGVSRYFLSLWSNVGSPRVRIFYLPLWFPPSYIF
jgi:hypothetical protein